MDYVQQMQRTGNLPGNSNPRPFTANNQQPVSVTEQKDPRIDQLKDEIIQQKNKFDRFLQINQTRISTLEKEVYELKDELRKATELLTRINDINVVSKSREALFNRKDKPPVDTPIDRTGVSPAQVQISKIFNCNGMKFK